VLLDPATGFIAFLTLSCAPRFAFSPYLVFHVPTVATTLLHVRIVLSLVDWSIMTALLATERNRLALGLYSGQPTPTPSL
jgi:hypothetical protein